MQLPQTNQPKKPNIPHTTPTKETPDPHKKQAGNQKSPKWIELLLQYAFWLES